MIFLDANVILYLFDVDERKRVIAREVVGRALGGGGTISFQVVQEVLNILTRVGAPGDAEWTATQVLREILLPLWQVMPTGALYERALAVQGRYGYAFYDSLIVAGGLEAGCRRLLTEDLQDGQRIEQLVIENPFRA